MRTVNQLHQGFHTLRTERDLKVGKEEANGGKPEETKEGEMTVFTLIITHSIQ